MGNFSIADLEYRFWTGLRNGTIGTVGAKGDPGGIVKGTVIAATTDLDTLQTDGLYYAAATSRPNALTLHYPHSAMTAGILKVSTWYMDNVDVVQTFETANVVGGMTNMIYQRTSFNDVWTPWKGIAPRRIDQTAGRAIYEWDDVNNREQRIYGDTGWRDISADLINGATATLALIRRINDTVTFRVSGLQLPSTAVGDVFYTVPTGFIVDSTYGILRESVGTGGAFGFNIGATIIHYGNITAGANNTTHRFQGSLNAVANTAWPTVLPGTAYGAINAV